MQTVQAPTPAIDVSVEPTPTIDVSIKPTSYLLARCSSQDMREVCNERRTSQMYGYAMNGVCYAMGDKSASRQANARWSANRWVASRHVGIDASSGCFVRIGATEHVIKCGA